MSFKDPLMLFLSASALVFYPAVSIAQNKDCSPEEIAAGASKCVRNSSQTISEVPVGKDGTVHLDAITVLANRSPIDVLKYPGSVSVVNGADNGTESTAIRALTKVPGFENGGDMGRPDGQQYSVRGFGYKSDQRVIIKVDGIRRSPSLFSNHISSFRVDPTMLKTMEVVKGTSSILHGSGAIGGVVGMKTKEAKDFIKEGRQIGLTVEGRYESNNQRSSAVTLAADPTAVPIDFLVHVRGVWEDDIRRADGKDTDHHGRGKNLVAKFGWDISAGQRLQLSATHYQKDVKTVWQQLYHNGIDPDGPIIGTISQTDYAANYSWNPEDNSLIDLTIDARYSKASYDRGWSSFSNPSDTGQYVNREERYGISAKNVAEFDTGFIRNRLITGFDYDVNKESSTFVIRGRNRPIGSMPNKITDIGIYAQNQFMMFDRLSLFVGGRYDYFKREIKGKPVQFSGSNFAPRIGAAFEVFEGVTLLANYAETFRAPTPSETSSEGSLNPHYYYLPNPKLRPEKGKEFEVGFSIDRSGLFVDADRLKFKAMYFNGRIEDMIALKTLPKLGPSPNRGSPYGRYVNVDEARRNGFEITASYESGPWALEGSYEHLNIYDSRTNKKVPQGFADKLRIAASYTIVPWDLTIGGDVSHWFKPDQNPKTITFPRKTFTYVDKPFTKANVKAVWKPTNTGFSGIDGSLEVIAGINNIFDRKYINARDTNTTSRVGAGRNFYLNVKKSF